MCWKFRIQVSEEGIHRPPVGGIAGRAQEGCQSIVLAGGYEDDTDDGFEFIYTGSGGRDLSGNKRTAEQSSDQTLEKMNLAIARNCDAPIDKVKGAEAKDWKKGKPIRVVRSSKLKKHSKYAPDEGNRYDGLYKVVKYWPEKGRSGYLVWRYLLRRDDPSLAPWEPGAPKFPCILMEGAADKTEGKASDEENPAKKIKVANFVPDKETKDLFKKDKLNVNLWKACLDFEGDKKSWYDHVGETFGCVICRELLEKPVTLPCLHNVCLSCLERSFKAEVYTCPVCRHELGKAYEKSVNKECEAAIKKLFSV
jgi:E3 ubiquitin-protein ligase UHRF1